jgi:hypothetical protein
MSKLPFNNFGFISDESGDNWEKIEEDGSITQIYYGFMYQNEHISYEVCTYVKNYGIEQEFNIIRDFPYKVYQYIQYQNREKIIIDLLDGDK